MTFQPLAYNVKTIRAAGIECKWSRTRHGQPIIIGKTQSKNNNGQYIWAYIDTAIWEAAKSQGLKAAFDSHTCLIGFLSIPA